VRHTNDKNYYVFENITFLLFSFSNVALACRLQLYLGISVYLSLSLSLSLSIYIYIYIYIYILYSVICCIMRKYYIPTLASAINCIFVQRTQYEYITYIISIYKISQKSLTNAMTSQTALHATRKPSNHSVAPTYIRQA